MKKLSSALSIIVGLGLASAQQAMPKDMAKTPPPKVQKMEAAKPAVEAKSTMQTTSPAEVKPAMEVKPLVATTAVKVKKDGTPDKRYKANAHLKKDGTPDKRYKAK